MRFRMVCALLVVAAAVGACGSASDSSTSGATASAAPVPSVGGPVESSEPGTAEDAGRAGHIAATGSFTVDASFDQALCAHADDGMVNAITMAYSDGDDTPVISVSDEGLSFNAGDDAMAVAGAISDALTFSATGVVLDGVPAVDVSEGANGLDQLVTLTGELTCTPL